MPSLVSFLRRPGIQTLSYARDMSRNTAYVFFFLFMLILIRCSRSTRLSIVLLPFRKPDWKFGSKFFVSRCQVSRALTSRSNILLRHDSKEMARYDSCFWRSLPGFRRGMTVASFQESGTKPHAYILLKRTKRIARLEKSSLSSMLLWTKSAPIAVGFKFLRAFSSSVAVNGELSWLADGETILAATEGSTVVCDESKWLEMSKKFKNISAFAAASVTVVPSSVFRLAVSTEGSPPFPCIAFMNLHTFGFAPLGSSSDANFCHDSLCVFLMARILLAAAFFFFTKSSNEVGSPIHSAFASSASFILSLHSCVTQGRLGSRCLDGSVWIRRNTRWLASMRLL